MQEAPSVLFLTTSVNSAKGGIQRFNTRIVKALANSNVHSRCLSKEDSTGVHNLVHGFSGSGARFTFKALKEFRRTDVLLLGHINLLPLATIYKVVRPSGRVVLFAHGVEAWGDAAYRKVKPWDSLLLRTLVDQIAVVSHYTMRLMASAFRVKFERFTYFPNTVSYAPHVSVEKRAQKNVLTVSRLALSESEKHVDKVVAAFPDVLRVHPTAKLIIVGDGHLRAELENLSRELEVEQSVLFKGYVSEEVLAELYGSATCFVLPSSKEGFGIVYLEAWLAGLPVVASKYGAAPEVVRNGVDGFTVDPNDPSQISYAINRLLSDQRLGVDMAEAGLENVRTNFSDEVLSRNLTNLLTGPNRQ